MLAGISGRLIVRLQSVLNAAARLVFKTRMRGPITPFLRELLVRPGVPLSSGHSPAIPREWSSQDHGELCTSQSALSRHHFVTRPVNSTRNPWGPCVLRGCTEGVELIVTRLAWYHVISDIPPGLKSGTVPEVIRLNSSLAL